ncbi:hypothetical protein L3X38_010064 [Prunus dulcis]|uniref:Uncharacterized protein n=1 Tax=Prunus dulcis TaxID=3755 RepID=A0AAD4ZDV6_PRUDU|nr:hypothetical protein L3X38_010064 [Prunus dulcis]
METIVILVCYNGKWVTSKKMCKYEGGDSKGLIVPRPSNLLNCWTVCIRLYNSEVTPSKLAPLLVSIEDKGLTNDVVHSMHITTDSSRMGHSSVAIVESNEVTWNNTNVTDVGGEVGTDFIYMIDFS